jgi:hypothetical protein
MKRLLPLVLAGAFTAVHPVQGIGRDTPAYSQSGHPTNTSHTSSQALETAKDSSKPTGPVHVSVRVATEEKGNSATTFPKNTPHLFGTFRTTGTNKGDRIHAVWVNSSTKKPLYKIDMTSTEPNFYGTVSISAPPTGWPPGKYELDIYLGNKMAGSASFNIKG